MRHFADEARKELQNTFLGRLWGRHRANQLTRRYQQWHDWAHRQCGTPLSFDIERTREQIRARTRGVCVPSIGRGPVNSYLVTRTDGWGVSLLRELSTLGPVTLYDWRARGYTEEMLRNSGVATALNRDLKVHLKRACDEGQIDWVLFSCNGSVVLADTIKWIKDELGLLVVNQWLDCKHTFYSGERLNGQDCGLVDIAPYFDVSWTSSRAVCPWYYAVGATPYCAPEGFCPATFPRENLTMTHEVSFVGACYGSRLELVEGLRRAGIRVTTAGPGWRGGLGIISFAEMSRLYNSTRINLGIGRIGYSTEMTTLKGRDFEVPGSGGAYLTTYDWELATYYQVGPEILCYKSVVEAVDIIRYYLSHKGELDLVRERGRERAMKCHRWRNRFLDLLTFVEEAARG